MRAVGVGLEIGERNTTRGFSYPEQTPQQTKLARAKRLHVPPYDMIGAHEVGFYRHFMDLLILTSLPGSRERHRTHCLLPSASHAHTLSGFTHTEQRCFA